MTGGPGPGSSGTRSRTPARQARFSADRELSMSKPNRRRVILRAARLALASGGICLLLTFPAQQAHAATGGQPPLLGGLTGVVGSIVSTVTGSVTGTVKAAASAPVPASQVTPTASGSPPSQPAAPSGGQASSAVSTTPPG